jgi:hypothetical protein
MFVSSDGDDSWLSVGKSFSLAETDVRRTQEGGKQTGGLE